MYNFMSIIGGIVGVGALFSYLMDPNVYGTIGLIALFVILGAIGYKIDQPE